MRLCVKVRGRGRIPSSLVCVSVPASGSVSSSAPGSLKGLSLEKKTRQSVQSGNKGKTGGFFSVWPTDRK